MKIGIVGGTGKEGAGLGARWAQAGHEVVIGSRDPARAQAKGAGRGGGGAGGGGEEGAGVGARWAQAGHEFVIGSRDPARAQAKAAELSAAVPGARITGAGNRDAAATADIVGLAVPAEGLGGALPDGKGARRGK